jgi:transposase
MTDYYYLTDDRWALIASRVPGKDGDPGCHGLDNRLFIEAVFWIVRTGSSWRKLPSHFGKWYTNYTRFRRWTQKRVWPEVLNALAEDETCEFFYEGDAIRYAPPPLGQSVKQQDPAVIEQKRQLGLLAMAPEKQLEAGRESLRKNSSDRSANRWRARKGAPNSPKKRSGRLKPCRN